MKRLFNEIESMMVDGNQYYKLLKNHQGQKCFDAEFATDLKKFFPDEKEKNGQDSFGSRMRKNRASHAYFMNKSMTGRPDQDMPDFFVKRKVKGKLGAIDEEDENG